MLHENDFRPELFCHALQDAWLLAWRALCFVVGSRLDKRLRCSSVSLSMAACASVVRCVMLEDGVSWRTGALSGTCFEPVNLQDGLEVRTWPACKCTTLQNAIWRTLQNQQILAGRQQHFPVAGQLWHCWLWCLCCGLLAPSVRNR